MVYLDWYEIEDLCHVLADELRGKFDVIYGVPRGGLVPAVILSHLLGIPIINEEEFWERMAPETRILIVDDINDTGATIESLKSVNKNSKIAVIYERNSSTAEANYFGDTIFSDVWLVFPWESKDKAERDRKEYLESRNKE